MPIQETANNDLPQHPAEKIRRRHWYLIKFLSETTLLAWNELAATQENEQKTDND